MKVVEGVCDGAGLRLAVLAARSGESLSSRLLESALETLKLHGVRHWDIVVYRTPGIWELSLVAREIALYGHFDALVALGAPEKGARRAKFLFKEILRGLARVSFEQRTPLGFGILTCGADDLNLAKAEETGAAAAVSAIETANLLASARGRRLRNDGKEER